MGWHVRVVTEEDNAPVHDEGEPWDETSAAPHAVKDIREGLTINPDILEPAQPPRVVVVLCRARHGWVTGNESDRRRKAMEVSGEKSISSLEAGSI